VNARADAPGGGAIALAPAPPDAAFGTEQARAARARDLFDALQDRHVAFSPKLARCLAKFEQARSPATDAFWGRAYGLASVAIGLGQLGDNLGHAQSWARLFSRFVLVVVEPILREGARRGVHDLVLTTKTRATDSAEAGKSFARIDAWVERALRDADKMGQAFWIAAGVSLLMAFRKQRASHGDRVTLSLPSVPDPRLAELVYAMEPELEEDPLWRKIAPKPSARSNRLRVGVRPREGGVTGVLHTRRLRDLPDALPSAFLMPKSLLVAKLIEEGFMIPHRPPYRRPDRDLLSLTMQAPEVETLNSAMLVKAAWIDAAIRLRILLSNISMRKSELGYAHLRDTGTTCAAMSLSEEMPKGRLDPMRLKEDIRRKSVSRSAIFADVFDTVAPKQRRRAKRANTTPEMRARDQILAACARAKPGRKGVVSMEDYARICMIELAPAVVRGDETVTVSWREDRSALRRRYGFDRQDTIHCARILCPPQLVAGAFFTVCADDDADPQDITIPQAETAQDSLQKALGAMSGWIIKQNLLATVHG